MSRFSAPAAFRAAAVLGMLGVALGAFGAHALQAFLAAHGRTALWEKAVFYHLVHAVVLLTLPGLRAWPRTAWTLLAAGVALFSGSLYLYALTEIHFLVFLTPLGGVCLLAGWLGLACHRLQPFSPLESR